MQRRTAIVTGGAIRVGRAIVQRLTRDGFRVLLTYRGSVDEARTLVALAPQQTSGVHCDLSNTETAVDTVVKSLNDLTHDAHAPLDLLVNNASMYIRDSELDGNGRTEMFATNVLSPVALVDALAENLRTAGGSVVNMIDIMADRPAATFGIYCASKAALANATLSMAKSLAPAARANGIAPGVVDWPDDLSLDQRKKLLSRVPLARAGTPEDVAAVVSFLAGEGSYITGQIIRLDGGRSIR